MSAHRRGITLIELLVVIAILAVLAALALPAYQAARQRGNVARSTNNLRQFHLAIQLYAETHGQSSPLGFGLPHRGIGTLLGLNMVTYELTRTGGSNWKGGWDSDVYVWFPPLLPRDEQSQHMRDWQEHVERTQENPVLMLDQSHNPVSLIHDPFHPKLCIVLWADGQVQTTRRRGIVATLDMWERR